MSFMDYSYSYIYITYPEKRGKFLDHASEHNSAAPHYDSLTKNGFITRMWHNYSLFLKFCKTV